MDTIVWPSLCFSLLLLWTTVVDQLVGGTLEITNDLVDGGGCRQFVKDGLRSEQSVEGHVEGSCTGRMRGRRRGTRDDLRGRHRANPG